MVGLNFVCKTGYCGQIRNKLKNFNEDSKQQISSKSVALSETKHDLCQAQSGRHVTRRMRSSYT
jgi:hypothetical protein